MDDPEKQPLVADHIGVLAGPRGDDGVLIFLAAVACEGAKGVTLTHKRSGSRCSRKDRGEGGLRGGRSQSVAIGDEPSVDVVRGGHGGRGATKATTR